MKMDDALEIIKPDRDSQYLLLPCPACYSSNVAYVKYQHPAGERWRVQCFDCGETTDPAEPLPRHDIQLLWNKKTNKPAPFARGLDDDRENCGLLEED